MMDVIRSAETSVGFYQTTWCYNPEDLTPHFNIILPFRTRSSLFKVIYLDFVHLLNFFFNIMASSFRKWTLFPTSCGENIKRFLHLSYTGRIFTLLSGSTSALHGDQCTAGCEAHTNFAPLFIGDMSFSHPWLWQVLTGTWLDAAWQITTLSRRKTEKTRGFKTWS
jgi:hypothetical protein